MNDEKKYLQLLGKVLSREASDKEQQQLEDWARQTTANKQFVEDTTTLWDKSAHYNTSIITDKKAAWNRLNRHLTAAAPSKKVHFKALWYKVAAAMLLAALGVTWMYPYGNGNPTEVVRPILASISTGEQEQREVALPDGSTVFLNGTSTLTYDRAFQTRQVTLEGEAFFDVTKRPNQPFTIQTAETRTTVLGTSFNVRAYANQATEITVLTGKVAFEPLDASKGERVLLLPKEMASYQATQGVVKELQEDNNPLAWKTKTLEFNNQALATVLPVLERYYDVKIEGSASLLNCHYTGNFNQVDLEEVLQTIAFTFATEVNIEKINDKYVLTGQGCD